MSGQTYQVWLMEGNCTLTMDGVTGLIQDETGTAAYFYREGKVYSRSARDPFCTVMSDGRMVDEKGNQVGFMIDYPRFLRNRPGRISKRGAAGEPAAVQPRSRPVRFGRRIPVRRRGSLLPERRVPAAEPLHPSPPGPSRRPRPERERNQAAEEAGSFWR